MAMDLKSEPGRVLTAATVHLAAAVPDFSWMEIRESPTEHTGSYDAELFPTRIEQDGPKLSIPDTPGLGVAFDVELAASRPYQAPRKHFLRRQDGSLTNA
jgi:galactonate dehydratase